MSDTLTDGLLEAAQLLRTDGVLLPIVVGETKHAHVVRFALAFAEKLEKLADARKRLAPAPEPEDRSAYACDNASEVSWNAKDEDSYGEPREPVAPQAEPAQPDPKDARIAELEERVEQLSPFRGENRRTVEELAEAARLVVEQYKHGTTGGVRMVVQNQLAKSLKQYYASLQERR